MVIHHRALPGRWWHLLVPNGPIMITPKQKDSICRQIAHSRQNYSSYHNYIPNCCLKIPLKVRFTVLSPSVNPFKLGFSMLGKHACYPQTQILKEIMSYIRVNKYVHAYICTVCLCDWCVYLCCIHASLASCRTPQNMCLNEWMKSNRRGIKPIVSVVSFFRLWIRVLQLVASYPHILPISIKHRFSGVRALEALWLQLAIMRHRR